MSLHRRAARRDDNEGEIRNAFKRHRWHTEALSAAGMPDLLAWPPHPPRGSEDGDRCCYASALVDVKGKDGTATEAQREKWTALAEKGIPVYVCRTAEDVDALVRGELMAWAPDAWRPVQRIGLTPPRSKPKEAAKAAEETFAPKWMCLAKGCRRDAEDGAQYCGAHA